MRSAIPMLLLLFCAVPAQAQKYAPHKPNEPPRIIYADSLVSLNEMCLVENRKLSLTIEPVYVNEKPVGFCCSPCPVTFSRDPAPYVKVLSPKLKCMVHPNRPAKFDSSTCAFVNQDVYFLWDREAKRQFLADPLKYVHRLSDPVSFHRFTPSADSPHLEYHGRPYYFEGPDTFQQFQTGPQNYAVRGGEDAPGP